MTPREQLKFLEDHHASFDIKEFDEVAAALRELDKLLEEAYKQFHNQMHHAGGFNILEVMKLYERLAQAGYGEK